MSRTLLLLAVSACTGGMTDSSTVEQGACVALEDRRFSSVNELECGRAPGGIARCKWQLSFAPSDPGASELTWFYSDVGETGRARCDDTSRVTGIVGGREIAGSFDAITQHLIWAGEIYISQ